MSESRKYAPYAFSFNEEYFSSPNSSTFPASLPSPWSPLPDNPTPRQLRDRLWYSSGYPYLPYILKSPFHGDLLRRLSVPVERIEVIYDGSSWHLTKQNAKDWKALENILYLAAEAMASFVRRSSPKTPLTFKPPKVPSKYGYFDAHESEPVARAAASSSLDAFAVYLGYISFLVAICQFGIDSRSNTPSWRVLLERQENRVHTEWLKLLVKSPIVDFTQERLGVVTHVSKCDWLHLASYLTKASVPVWFNWGKIPYYTQPSHTWISDYYPDLDNFTPVVPTNAGLYPPVNSGTGQRYSETMEQFFARRHKRDQAVKAKETPREREIRVSREQAQQSRPFPGKKGPSVFSWDNVNGFRIRTSIARSQVQTLWNHWSNSEKIYNSIDNCWDCCVIFGNNSLPGEPDPSDSDSDSDSDLPCADIVPQPPPVSNTWDSEHPAGRNADGAEPQPPPAPGNWDSPASRDADGLNPQPDNQDSPAERNADGMDPQPASTPDSHTSSFPVDSMDIDDTSPPEQTANLVMSNPSTHASQQRVISPTDTFDQLPPADREAIPIAAEDEEDMETDDLYQDVLAANPFHCVSFSSSRAQTVDDLVYYRFGFSLKEETYSGVPLSISPTPITFRNWYEVVCAVGGQGMENSSGANQDAITDFLECILSSTTPLQVVPGKFWDLSPDGANPLNELTTRFIRVEKRQFVDRTPDPECQFDGRPWYLLRPSNLHPTRDTSWCIAVDALTALECIRRGLGPHSLDIANYFVDHGIPFTTLEPLRPASQLPLSPSRLPSRVLGRRPKGYKFNLADYAAYITLRDSYLSSRSHARAALCAGGIVARLARESLSAVAALSGPSQSALEGNQLVLASNGQLFCDDRLSEADTDLICGVYEVETGNEDPVALVSWFPRHNIWLNCGLNVGTWTHHCEDWYTKRVEAIQRDAQPSPQKKWRECMRYSRKATKLVFHMNCAAAAYIDENFCQMDM